MDPGPFAKRYPGMNRGPIEALERSEAGAACRPCPQLTSDSRPRAKVGTLMAFDARCGHRALRARRERRSSRFPTRSLPNRGNVQAASVRLKEGCLYLQLPRRRRFPTASCRLTDLRPGRVGDNVAWQGSMMGDAPGYVLNGQFQMPQAH